MGDRKHFGQVAFEEDVLQRFKSIRGDVGMTNTQLLSKLMDLMEMHKKMGNVKK